MLNPKNIYSALQRKFGLNTPRYQDWNGKYLYLYDLFLKIEKVDGCIVECGVAYGDTLVALAIFSKRESGREVFGLDSFKGFPKPLNVDASPRDPKEGEFGDTSMKLVSNRIKKSGAKAKLLKGFIGELVPEMKGKKIAFLHIDVDMYEGYKDALELYDQVEDGGIIAFDEYGTTNWPGATKAVDEWLEKSGERLQQHPSSKKYFVVKGQK